MAITQERFQQMIGERVKYARKETGMTQEQLSTRLGFKDRQILANIESGKRRVAADELVKLTEIFSKTVEFFTDSTLLIGQGAFCWRAPDAGAQLLDDFESKAGRWIAAYRSLGEQKGESFRPLVAQLPITERSSFEEAEAAGEALVSSWDLGPIPAQRIYGAVEEKLGVLVLWVDAPSAISGAACRLTEFDTILVNRREPDGRRNFDFAHELFHLLTWDRLPPDRIDSGASDSRKARRIEQLANKFASALLMPIQSLMRYWQERGRRKLHSWLNEVACEFMVTSQALYYRLRALSWLSEGDCMEVNTNLLTWNGKSPSEQTLPKLFSRGFVDRFCWGIESGHASVRWVSELFGCTINQLRTVFQDYGMAVPFDL